MKVLFTFGGVPHYLDAMLNKLQAGGVEVVVVTPQKGNATIGKGVKMVETGSYKRLIASERRLFYGKNGYPSLPQLVREEAPAILVIGWPYFLQLFFQPSLRKALQACGTKIVIREIPFQTPPFGQIKEYFRMHPMYNEAMCLQSSGLSFYIRQLLTMLIRRYCYSKAAATLNYSTVAYDILPSYGVKRKQIHVTFNSTDTETLLREKEAVLSSPSLLPPCPRRILHIGRLVKWKRVDLLIEAMPLVTKQFPDAELVVVGDGPELETLKQQAEQLKLNHRVRFAGSIYKPQELGAYMNESTVYVLAGMGGLSINDAMTYGLPIICSVCDSTERDLVTEGENGFFFHEGDAHSLAEKITTLFASPALCQEMGKESQRIIFEKINIETVSQHYLHAFKAILSE